MAPPFSFLLSWPRSEDRNRKSLKTMVVYLVRSFGLMPESVSHDWHVQPSCQRPNRGPPKRCEFSPGDLAFCERTHKSETDCPRNFTSIRCGCDPVNRRFPQDFQMISTSGKVGAAAGELASKNQDSSLRSEWQALRGWRLWGALYAYAQQYGLPVGMKTPLSERILRQPETEDKKLRKDPFGGPCFEGTLRKLWCFPNEVPWPGRMRALSRALLRLRCRTSPRVADNTTG